MHPENITTDSQAGVLEIFWSDKHTQQFTHAFLRRQCQCADCKALRLQTQDAMAISTEIRIKEIRPTGTYGMQFLFSDGHDRGIYPWSYLYQLTDDAATI